MGIIEGARQRLGAIATEAVAGGALGALEVIRASYSFAVDAGAVSTINLLDAANVPSGFVVCGGFIDVTTPVTGPGASVALGLNTTTDLLAAAAISGAPWSTAGIKAIIPVMTAATAVKATAARNVTATISAAVVTAGVFDVYLIGVRTA